MEAIRLSSPTPQLQPPSSPSTSRRGLVFLLLAALAGLAVLASVAVLAGGSRGQAGGAQRGDGPYRGSEPPGRIELPAFELPSYRGGHVASSDLRGTVVLLTLLDSQCTDACPILASVVARAVDELAPAEQARVRALAITSDPAEDTRASVRRFLRRQRAEGRLDYLLGSERDLRPLWSALHVLPSLDTGRDTLHSAPLRIYDRSGIWVATLHAGADLSETNLLHDIRVALAARDDATR
jgi:cytochrome oxidase Cu insertion factor (SCO1/SenC/PrrC family)